MSARPRPARLRLALCLALGLLAGCTARTAPEPDQAAAVRGAFLHAWQGYERYAWGHDQLLPLSRGARDWYPASLVMTPLDAFDTMLLMGLRDEAARAKTLILDSLSFDRDFPVQVFEVTIRLPGGLITAYQMDGDPRFLALARDLGERLLPAFRSRTGMPYRFVNLRTGAVSGPVSNPAEVGTLMLEFGTLSKLTGDQRYYDTAKRAVVTLFERRSSIGLVGSTISVETGAWVDRESHVTGGIDSYGERSATRFGALDAFLPAVLAKGGDTLRAGRLMRSVYLMWTTFGIEPEELDYVSMPPVPAGYVLRPEAIESAYYLHRLTGDRVYREMGRVMVDSLLHYTRAETGFAALRSVVTKEQRDQMESYAYLLFAPPATLDFDAVVFNTEAHPIRRTWN